MTHHYPADLARFVHANWFQACRHLGNELPPVDVLAELLSVCYQASLMTEELRAVTFRVVLLPPEEMAADDGPPRGYHRIRFTDPRPLLPNTLRKLSPAVEFSHSLLGIQRSAEGFDIWGIVHSGPRWINSFYSSRRPFQPLPSCLVISVTGPGSLSVSNGSVVVAKMSAGQINAPGPEVLSSDWLAHVFLGVRQELEHLHISACDTCPPVTIDPLITRHLAQGLLRRCLQLLRKEGHGGTLLIVPPAMAAELERPNPYVTIRYALLDEEPRRRYRTLLVRLMNRLGKIFPSGALVGWKDYVTCDDAEVTEVDEALEEFSHLLASLGSVDGAALLTQRLELLGFGVEIAGNLPAVGVVQRAEDIEAKRTTDESTEGVGTRHRSAYRLCAQLPDLLALVLSQDGRIQLIKQFKGQVTCWDQLSTGARDV